METVSFPLTTGQTATLLGVPDFRLEYELRCGRIQVERLLGRRAWGPAAILQAARVFGVDGPEIRNVCEGALASHDRMSGSGAPGGSDRMVRPALPPLQTPVVPSGPRHFADGNAPSASTYHICG